MKTIDELEFFLEEEETRCRTLSEQNTIMTTYYIGRLDSIKNIREKLSEVAKNTRR